MRDKLIWLYNWLCSRTILGKVIFCIITFLAFVLILFGCSSTRTVSLSVDKAEKVEFNMNDSIGAYYPL